MAVYKITANTDLNVNGIVIPGGTQMGFIVTDLPVSNLISAAAFGNGAVAPVVDLGNIVGELETIAAASTRDATAEHATRSKQAKPAVEQIAAAVDALNAEPDDDTDTETDDSETAPVLPPADAPVTIPETLNGLPPRIAAVLAKHELPTRDAVHAFMVDGGMLTDLEGIGKSAANKIAEWVAKK